ncbi:hypothetical protein AVEN_153434-1 [Araneus ventricosus]|uniref:Uncharacterized protein n=1 Tax=Araneus ventricosus TaxID=182803 RepID=A0A4Y2QK26_ARAVE|nr:hypothetical protein AVEN_153434-1 [Araneus ventricosus]
MPSARYTLDEDGSYRAVLENFLGQKSEIQVAMLEKRSEYHLQNKPNKDTLHTTMSSPQRVNWSPFIYVESKPGN